MRLYLSVFLLVFTFTLPKQAVAEAMEFTFPVPFQQLYAPVNRLYSTFARNHHLISNVYIANVDVVASGQIIQNSTINPQNNNNFTQLVEAGAWLENSSMGAGNWSFMPGSGLKGHNTAGINHGEEVLCSCNTPEHDLKMVLAQGTKVEGHITLNYAEQHVFGDYHASTTLNNGAYQVIFHSARVFGNTNIHDFAETNLRGTVMPNATINLHSGGVFRISDQARLEGSLNIQGGLAFAYDDAFIKAVTVTQGGSLIFVNSSNYNNVSVGDISLLDGKLEANGGKFKNILAQKGSLKFNEPGILDKSPGPSVSDTLEIGPEVELILEGDTTPLALNSNTSTLKLKNGTIKLEAGWWQTHSTIRQLNGEGKIIFAYTLNPSFLMAHYPKTPMPISQLTILNGQGSFNVEIFGYPKRENSEQENLPQPRPIPSEFVLIEDYSNALEFTLGNEVNIEGRTYTLETRGENPKLWVLKTGQPEPSLFCPLKGNAKQDKTN